MTLSVFSLAISDLKNKIRTKLLAIVSFFFFKHDRMKLMLSIRNVLNLKMM